MGTTVWDRRIRLLLANQAANARRILKHHGFTHAIAKRFVQNFAVSGVIKFKSNTPRALHDPTHPAHYALSMLPLVKELKSRDSVTLQLGRLWARADTGMQWRRNALGFCSVDFFDVSVGTCKGLHFSLGVSPEISAVFCSSTSRRTKRATITTLIAAFSRPASQAYFCWTPRCSEPPHGICGSDRLKIMMSKTTESETALTE
jgi:hypothetical protein